MKSTDVRIRAVAAYLLPLKTRTAMAFGGEVLNSITVLRVRMAVENGKGLSAEGWGETPLSIEWTWPCPISYTERQDALIELVGLLTSAWSRYPVSGHAIEVGQAFQQEELPRTRAQINSKRSEGQEVPMLAAIACSSAFDLALHDAYGMVNKRPIYSTYSREFLTQDLRDLTGSDQISQGIFPCRFLEEKRRQQVQAWHLVAAADALEKDDLDGSEPDDGYPTYLREWIRKDGLRALKIKLKGVDIAWDSQRLNQIARISVEEGVERLAADFNCTVQQPEYVLEVLDRLNADVPQAAARLRYVEQPFGRDLEQSKVKVSKIASRVPILLDESAHDWESIEQGRKLGWNGTALKVCKGQTGALLMLAWSKLHDMRVMVQDLTNPMLAQVPHVLLAAHGGSEWGVETNSMQFYPEASKPEATVHPGIYQRCAGLLDLRSIDGPGFGYRQAEVDRKLPEATFECEST